MTASETTTVTTTTSKESNVSEVKRGRGRPAVYTGAVEKAIVKVIKTHGLMRGRKYLAEVGVQVKPGQGKRTFAISLPTLGKLAARHGIELHRGRPKSAKKAA